VGQGGEGLEYQDRQLIAGFDAKKKRPGDWPFFLTPFELTTCRTTAVTISTMLFCHWVKADAKLICPPLSPTNDFTTFQPTFCTTLRGQLAKEASTVTFSDDIAPRSKLVNGCSIKINNRPPK
jgi:hypothetical protein